MISAQRLFCPQSILAIAWCLSLAGAEGPGRRDYGVGGLSVEIGALPYDFDHPAADVKLEKDLTEISGLTWLGDSLLAAVQDEDGLVFFMRASDGEILSQKKFGPDGDYEGIERHEDRLFVLRSDGRLYEIADWHEEQLQTIEHRTALRKRNDAEGLALDENNNRLLVACKEYPGKGYRGFRAVYAYDLTAGKLGDEPVLLISASGKDLNPGDGPVSRRIREILGWAGFKPSAIAAHPISGLVYVVSSTTRILAVFELDGRIVAARRLDGDLLRQPEGLAFAPNGDLFIASEGRGKRARLVRYAYEPPPGAARAASP